MTEQAGLEQGYRWLLAAYPRGFHREHQDEMLAVLMAGRVTAAASCTGATRRFVVLLAAA